MKTILHAPGVAPQSLPADLEAASNPSDSSLKVLVTTRPRIKRIRHLIGDTFVVLYLGLVVILPVILLVTLLVT